MATKTNTAPPETTQTLAIATLDQAHQWTHDGKEVLILKCVNRDGLSYSGTNKLNQQVAFHWPLTVGATVDAPDWKSTQSCGGGLHGWAWGFGLGDGKEPDWSAAWLVFGALPVDVIGNLDGDRKCKARVGTVRFVGDWNTPRATVPRPLSQDRMAVLAPVSSGVSPLHGGIRLISGARCDAMRLAAGTAQTAN